MSHSGYDEHAERALKSMQEKLQGEMPDGRLNDSDEGAVAIGIGHQNGRVVIHFPKRLNWVGMTPEQAIEAAESLIEHARACGCKRVLEIKIG